MTYYKTKEIDIDWKKKYNCIQKFVEKKVNVYLDLWVGLIQSVDIKKADFLASKKASHKGAIKISTRLPSFS